MSNPSPTLVEGIDYDNEEGRWVFTAAYHQKRGHCCKSVCRHCPFGNSPTDRQNLVDESSSQGLAASVRSTPGT
jgi:hypothetical protein